MAPARAEVLFFAIVLLVGAALMHFSFDSPWSEAVFNSVVFSWPYSMAFELGRALVVLNLDDVPLETEPQNSHGRPQLIRPGATMLQKLLNLAVAWAFAGVLVISSMRDSSSGERAIWALAVLFVGVSCSVWKVYHIHEAHRVLMKSASSTP
jgi:hypothetical protein